MFVRLNGYPGNLLKLGRMNGRTDLVGYRFTFASIDEIDSSGRDGNGQENK